MHCVRAGVVVSTSCICRVAVPPCQLGATSLNRKQDVEGQLVQGIRQADATFTVNCKNYLLCVRREEIITHVISTTFQVVTYRIMYKIIYERAELLYTLGSELKLSLRHNCEVSYIKQSDKYFIKT